MIIKSKPENEELPSVFADRLGLQYTKKVSADHKKSLGQYFTPIEVAKLMAQYCHTDSDKIHILDPGCGIGILTCALVEYIHGNLPHVKEIEITAFETDLDILPYTEQVFLYLGEWLKDREILFKQFICVNDFVLHNSVILQETNFEQGNIDIVICNPPYFKIAKNDPINTVARTMIYGQTNIYSVFLILAAKLLKEGGQLIFITPRSFTSGNYFKLFRKILYSLVEFKSIHLFESRRNAFSRDNVLQENVIMSCMKNTQVQSQLILPFSDRKIVQISTSEGLHDLAVRKIKSYEINELIDFESEQQIMHIPTSSKDDKAIAIFKSWKHRLSDFGIQISTGKVVAFRCKEWIEAKGSQDNVPLIWLNNVDKMKFTWPIHKFQKNKEKLQFIVDNAESSSVLIENSNYILLRRFSSKDDESKLIAAPYFSSDFDRYKNIGVENHLNYIYKLKGKFSENDIIGLSTLLNSKLFDVYFRTFNGNINVSATELRAIPLPDIKTIRKIGQLILKGNINMDEVDNTIEKIFKVNLKELKSWIN